MKEKIWNPTKNTVLNIFKTAEFFSNKLPNWLFIFTPLALLYLSFAPNSNEENYLQLAKYFINPDWISNSQNLHEVPGTRLLYQYITGYFLQYFSFEAVVFGFRFILILLFSLVLSKIYKAINISKTQILFHLALFIVVFNQSFFARSWFLISVESKTFAYLAVLGAFYFFLNKKLYHTLVFLILATYLHILVGGYSFAYFLLTIILFKKSHQLSFSKIFSGILIYGICLIPFLFYLKQTSLNYQISNTTISPDWIYTYFRSPHHTALFKSFNYFFVQHFRGILMAGVALLISIGLYSFSKNKKLKFLNQFIIVSLAGTLLLVSVAFLDKSGAFLKFYLYRINTLSVFFFSLLIPVWLFTFCKNEYLIHLKRIVVLLSVSLFLYPVIINLSLTATYFKSNKNLIEICEYIKNNTERDALIFSFAEDNSITRRTERSRFSVYKFIPAEVNKLQRWYDNHLEREAMLADPEKLKQGIKKNRIDYILTSTEQKLPKTYIKKYNNNEFILYKAISN